MGFIRLTQFQYSSSTLNTIKGLPYPYINSNGVYRDLTNIPTTDFYGDIDTYNYRSIRLMDSSQWFIYSAGATGYRNGYLNILNGTETSNIPTTTISGKYRLTAQNFTEYDEVLALSTIILDFTINDEIYKYICFVGGESWYDDYRPYEYSNLHSLCVGKSYQTYKATTEPEDFYQVSYGLGGSAVRTEFVNSVWDFGNVAVEVPQAFKDWIEANFEPIYPNTFTIKSEDGSVTLATLEEAPTMVSGFLRTTGNTKILTLTGVNDRTYTLQWESETPEDKAFLGLAFEPTNIVANIPIGIETYFTIDGDFSFYECYGKYKPVQTTFQVILYQNNAEPYRVDKSDNLTAVRTLNGALREDTSITDLSITFEMETIPDFNYIYIPIFNRYYFINDIRSIRYKIWEISASVDVLMSYKDAILNCVGFVDRNQLEFNSDIIDKKRVVELGHTIEVNSVTNELFTSTMGTYVLNGLLVSYVTEE